MYCWKCGKENREEAQYCKHCGIQLFSDPQAQTAQPAPISSEVEVPIEQEYVLPNNYAKLCPTCGGAMFSTEIPKRSMSTGTKVAWWLTGILIGLPLILWITSPYQFLGVMIFPIVAIPSAVYAFYQTHKNRARTVLRCERCQYEEKG